MKTAWNNPENLNDSFHPTKSLHQSNLKVLNCFAKTDSFKEDVGESGNFILKMSEIFNGYSEPKKFKESLLNSNMFELSYADYHQTQNLNGKTIVIENSNKSNLFITNCENSSIYV